MGNALMAYYTVPVFENYTLITLKKKKNKKDLGFHRYSSSFIISVLSVITICLASPFYVHLGCVFPKPNIFVFMAFCIWLFFRDRY